MSRLDLLSIAGLIGGATVVVVSLYLGGNMGLFWSISSVVVVLGGSIMATLLNFGREQITAALRAVSKIFITELPSRETLIELFLDLARKARREGLLGLEDDIDRLDDPFFQKGLRLMVDALEPDAIKNIMQNDMEAMSVRHEASQAVFKAMGTYSPAFGMIGTLIGLIQMLAQLEDPSTMGPAMSLALVTTFYGTVLANMVFLPMAGKLERRSQEELLNKELMLEAIIAIQSGINPRILEERLKSFLETGKALASPVEAGEA